MAPTLIAFSISTMFGLISAKWALDLGYSQVSQLLHLLAALVFGPLVLLVLYVRLIYKHQAEGTPGAQFTGMPKEIGGAS